MSVKEIARNYKLNVRKVTKILVTADVYSSKTYNRIRRLREEGMSEKEIASTLGIAFKSLNVYTPYHKGIHNLNNPTDNAIKIRKYRSK